MSETWKESLERNLNSPQTNLRDNWKAYRGDRKEISLLWVVRRNSGKIWRKLLVREKSQLSAKAFFNTLGNHHNCPISEPHKKLELRRSASNEYIVGLRMNISSRCETTHYANGNVISLRNCRKQFFSLPQGRRFIRWLLKHKVPFRSQTSWECFSRNTLQQAGLS